MAKSNEETEETTEGGTRSQMWKHEPMAAWLESEGHDLGGMTPAEIIALAFAARVAWRKTDTYINLVEEHRAAAAEAKADLASAAAERAAAKAEADKETKAEKAAAKKAPAKAKAKTKATKGKASKEDSPF